MVFSTVPRPLLPGDDLNVIDCYRTTVYIVLKLPYSYGKSAFIAGKSTINGPFSVAMLNYQMVNVGITGYYRRFRERPFFAQWLEP